MRSVVNILGKIFIALLAGVSIALVVVQRDEKFKALAYANVQQFFAQSFEGDLQGTVVEINLFSPRIIMNNLVIKPLPGKTGWQWTAQQATLYFSWLTFLLTGKISINIELMGYEADSELVNNQLAIAYHLDRLFSSPDTQIPAILKSLQIRKGILRAHDSINNIQAIAHVHIDMKRINQQPRIKFYITDGALHYEDKPYLRSLSGSVHVNPVDINNETKIKARESGGGIFILGKARRAALAAMNNQLVDGPADVALMPASTGFRAGRAPAAPGRGQPLAAGKMSGAREHDVQAVGMADHDRADRPHNRAQRGSELGEPAVLDEHDSRSGFPALRCQSGRFHEVLGHGLLPFPFRPLTVARARQSRGRRSITPQLSDPRADWCGGKWCFPEATEGTFIVRFYRLCLHSGSNAF